MISRFIWRVYNVLLSVYSHFLIIMMCFDVYINIINLYSLLLY